MSRGAWIAMALALAWAPARAQRVPVPRAPCSYLTCALSLQHNRVVAGLDQREVARFGWFAEPELRPLIELSDSASYYYGLVERDYPAGSYLVFVGALMGAVGYGVVRGKSEAEAQWIGGSLLAGGVTLAVFGGRKQRRARAALRASLAWYNDALLDAAESDPTAPARLPPGRPRIIEPGDHGRVGAVVGMLAGIGVGLAVSSRPSVTLGQGLVETTALGVFGGLLGWRVGQSFARY